MTKSAVRIQDKDNGKKLSVVESTAVPGVYGLVCCNPDGTPVWGGGSGSSEPKFRFSTMPTASSEYTGKIVEYIGETTSDYTKGYFYEGTHTSVSESITASETDNMNTIGTINVNSSTFKSKVNGGGSYVFKVIGYNTKLNYMNLSSIPVAQLNLTRESAIDRAPMIPNGPRMYGWVDDSNNFYVTNTLKVGPSTELYSYDISTSNGTLVTGYTFVSSTTPSQLEGYWVLSENNINEPVELEEYGITMSSGGLPGNEITVVYTEANDTYSWSQINVQPGGTGGDAVWGSITGTLSNQTDLQQELTSLDSNKSTALHDDGAPSTTPTKSGDIYTDDTTGNTYVSNGTASSANWMQVPRSSGGGATWGNITGTLSNQTDLNTALSGKQSTLSQSQLDATNSGITSGKVSTYDGYASTIAGKQNTLTAGSNISISGNTISATDTTYTAGTNISISGTTISATDTTYSAGNGLTLTGTSFSANVINGLNSTSTTDSLSANQGKVLNTSITGINEKIPAQATSSNQLADKDFVNSSINSVTAYYITKDASGNQFATKAELLAATTFYSGGEVRVPTRNDYCIVQEDESKDNSTTRYIYQNNQWEFQYIVNETALTAAQIAAINSGITSSLVSTYNGYATSKQDTLTAGSNITLNGSTISATDTTYSEGTGISISGTTINNSAPFSPSNAGNTDQVLTKTASGYEWAEASGGTGVEVITQAQYDALPSTKESDGVVRFIYTVE